MKKLRFFCTFILCIVLSLIPLQVSAASNKLKLNKSTVTLYTGQSCTLKATGYTGKVQWSSKNKNVAVVSSAGKVTAKKQGTTTITARAGKSVTKCTVVVKKKAAVEISNYFLKYKNLVSKLGMKKTEYWTTWGTVGLSRSYKKNGFYLMYTLSDRNTLFSMKNTKNTNVTLYGYKIGSSFAGAVKKLKKAGWREIEWVGAKATNSKSFLYKQKGEQNLITLMIDCNNNGKISEWYIDNWPRDGFIWK